MKSHESGCKFPNPNYNPEEWSTNPPEVINGLTGIPIIDAANKLSQKIEIDSLTGCFNRQHYENLKSHFDINRIENGEIALVFIDLNGLKEINDSLGHHKGDEVISLLACFLKAKFRKGDEVIRLGGDEFLIYCHNHNNDLQFEYNLQKKISNVQESFKKQLLITCLPLNKINLSLNGFAAGVAVFDSAIDSNLDSVLQRADHLMYENKKIMKGSINRSVII